MSDWRTGAGFRPGGQATFCGQKVAKEPDPAARVPFAALRGKPAPSPSCCGAAKLTACLWHSVQTRCRKSDVYASALCGADARNKRPPSQARAKGQGNQNSFSIKIDSCYRLINKRWRPISLVSSQIRPAVRSRFPPCVYACGTRFRLQATLPQDSVAS